MADETPPVAPGMEEPFDYVAGYDRMWQAQHDATTALLRVIGERDAALAEAGELRATVDRLRRKEASDV